MKPLTIELVNRQKRHLQSLGWKIPKGGDCRRQFYALDQTDKPLLVTPKPALPEFYDPNRQAKAIFTCEPFPEAVCLEISPCRLLPPPCYQSREDFERQLLAHYVLEPWRAIYWDTHRQVLILEHSDDGPLQERLDKWLAAMREQYASEAANWRKEIKRLTTATLLELGLATENERAQRVKEAEVQLGIIEPETAIDGVPCKGRLNLTLADVKRGCEGIRDAWKHEDWAKKNGEDLGVMARERWILRRWLGTHTGTSAIIQDASLGERYRATTPPSFGKHHDRDPKFQEACARVRYRARFADNANTVVYLDDCETREELDAVELDEVAKLRGTPASAEAAIQKATIKIVNKLAASMALTAKPLEKPNGGARLESDFSVAVILQAKGEPLRLTIEPELRSLLKRIIEAGGNIPRTKLREGKTDTFQPEKLLRSETAKALMKAGLLGSQRNGRTTVFWAKVRAD